MKTDIFQSYGHCWVFQICWYIECSTFTASSFGFWNSSTGIPLPPLALFIVMLSKPHLTSHSKIRSVSQNLCPPVPRINQVWPPDPESWLIGKDPDAGKDWRQEKKGTTEDEMFGLYHRHDGHEFQYVPAVGDGWGSLACCTPRGHKEWDTTEWLS